jgi:hypothetical protein
MRRSRASFESLSTRLNQSRTHREDARQRSLLGNTHVGAVAFSRTGNPATGKFSEPTLLGQFGEVNLDALSE